MKKLMVRKRLLALVFVLIYTVAIIAGCGSEKTEQPAETNNVTDTEATTTAEVTDPKLDKSEYYEILLIKETYDTKADEFKEQNYFEQILKEKFNFGFKCISYPGDKNEKLALMLAAGDYPDLLNIGDVRYLKQYIDAGALIDLEPLIEKYGPNFKKTHEERIPYWRTMSGVDDGKIWFFTNVQPNYSTGVSTPVIEWQFRSDILEQQGYPDMKNEDYIYEVLKKAIVDNPETNGMPTVAFSHPLASWGTNGLLCLSYTTNLGRLSHMTRKYGSIFDPDQNKFIDVTSDYSYKDGLRFFNKLWREGLFDKDAVTDNYDSFTKKMQEGRVLCTFFYNWDYKLWNESLANAGMDYRYVPYPGILKSQAEKGEMKIYPITVGEVWSSVSMTKNAKYPERLMEIIDWCNSEEGLIAAGWGREGEQYTIENGKRVPTAEHMRKMKTDPDYRYIWGGEGFFGLFGGLDSNGQNYQMSLDDTYVKLNTDPKILEVLNKYGWDSYYDQHNNNKNFKARYDYSLGLKMFTPSYDDRQNKDFEKIDALTHEYTMKLVSAESEGEFNRLFDEMRNKLNELGLQELVDIRNIQYLELKDKYNLE